MKITDFGLARLGEEVEENDPARASGEIVMGTPDYLSPEQGRNLAAADIRSDLYSLGCTLYYLLTGEVPFPGGSPLEKLERHATVDPEPVERTAVDRAAGSDRAGPPADGEGPGGSAADARGVGAGAGAVCRSAAAGVDAATARSTRRG